MFDSLRKEGSLGYEDAKYVDVQGSLMTMVICNSMIGKSTMMLKGL